MAIKLRNKTYTETDQFVSSTNSPPAIRLEGKLDSNIFAILFDVNIHYLLKNRLQQKKQKKKNRTEKRMKK